MRIIQFIEHFNIRIHVQLSEYILTANNFREPMTTPGTEYDQNQQTLQFYKIKLMEKEREISDHAAKLKKIQFKNNRDIKQLKMAEEKAKLQLKEEKQKLDKVTKSMTEVSEQNNVLQHRLNELKEEKDKEIESTRAQYNHLKTEVRSYERILPTHTFMSKFGFNYEQLPTYEHIFMNLKERSDRYDELDEKFKKFKLEAEEKIEMQVKVADSLQKKKVELEKQLRDDLTKLLDVETQVTTLSIEREELRNRVHDLSQELQAANQSNEELTEQNKGLEAKIEELARIYHGELQAKEEEIQKITEEEFRKYEDEIERITRTFEMKENSHLQQLAYFQEEEHRLNERIQKDKEKFEENYREMYAEVDRIKRELDAEKEQLWKQKEEQDKLRQQLNIKSAECFEYLQKLGEGEVLMEDLQVQLKALQQRLVSNKDESNSKYGSIVQEKKALEARLKLMEEELSEAREEILNKENEMRILLVQIDELRSKSSAISKGTSFYHSNGIEAEQIEAIRNRSNTDDNSEFEKVGSLQEVHISSVSKQLRSRQDSLISQKSEKRKSSISLYSQQQVDLKIAQTLREHEKEMESKMQRKVFEAKTALEHELKQKYSQEISELTKQQRKQVSELKKKEEQLQNKLKKIYEQNEMEKLQLNESISKLTRKYDLLKLEKETLEQNYIEHVNEAKRDKEGLNSFRSQNRQLEKTVKEQTKSMEGLATQLEALKKYREKVEARQNKQKSVSSESSNTGIKEVIEKYTIQITKLMEEKEEEIKLHHNLREEISVLKREIESKNQEIENLKSQLENKEREIKMLDDLLDHQKKDRTLRTVPSLASLPDQDGQEEENFKEFYNQAGQKEGQILLLEREVADLRAELEEQREKQEHRVAGLEQEMNGYIQEIIEMKLKVANAEMKASEKTHLFNQLKKKYNLK